MIALLTDYSLEGPYTGQIHAILHQQAPNIPVINLFPDLPPFNIQAAAYLLSAYTANLPPGSISLCVVDPGVGSARPGVVIKADGRWYVGPNEGLFALLARRARTVECWQLPEPSEASSSFHGRDVFAPVAAQLACDHAFTGKTVPAESLAMPDWPDDLYEVVYTDRFGNAMTGVRAEKITADSTLEVNGHHLPAARTFSDMPPGTAFWYANSNGLIEFAVNQGRAEEVLGVSVRTSFNLL